MDFKIAWFGFNLSLEMGEQKRMHTMGVVVLLVRCSLPTWTSQGQEEGRHDEGITSVDIPYTIINMTN